jgi:hypothetical protein
MRFLVIAATLQGLSSIKQIRYPRLTHRPVADIQRRAVITVQHVEHVNHANRKLTLCHPKGCKRIGL